MSRLGVVGLGVLDVNDLIVSIGRVAGRGFDALACGLAGEDEGLAAKRLQAGVKARS